MKVVAVTACPSGVAHTYLAAESLIRAAEKYDVEIAVETQGSIGIENELCPNMIKDCAAVVLTNNIGIKNEDRFKGKPILRLSAGDCIKKSDAIICSIVNKFGE